MNAGQFSKADAQNDNGEWDSEEKPSKSNRKWWPYGIGLLIFIAILVIYILIITCKFPFFNNFLPFCSTTPPTITKAFSPDSIAVNDVSILTFTLGNSNSVVLTDVTFTDALPSGLQVADLPSATTTCSGEPEWAPPTGATTLVFGSPAGGTIPAKGSCSVSVNIKGTALGSYESVSGYVSSANGGVNTGNTGRAVASITVTDLLGPDVLPPDMTVAFVPDQIPPKDTSLLTFTLINPNSGEALPDVTFSNTYPAGLTNAEPLAATNTCEGTLTAESGGGSVSLSGGVISAAKTCVVSVKVTASNEGTYTITSEIMSPANPRAVRLASDVLYVGAAKPMVPVINFLKEVSTSAEGPWTKFINVSLGTDIYYRFTIENLGNTPFQQFYITDPVVNTDGCSGSLSDASSGNHIKTCVFGPTAAEAGIHANTATVSGIYADQPYTTAPSTATYVTTPHPPSQTSLDLYLPESFKGREKFVLQTQGQLNVFNAANAGMVVNIKYYADAQSLMKGNVSGVIALPSRDVINFAQQELLLPVSVPSVQIHLADALEQNTFQDQLFAYPWQREICSINYLNLAVPAQLPANVVVLANKLGDFLTSETNQRANFESWQIYPTLDRFYHPVDKSKFPEVSCSPVDQQATSRAEELVNVLSEKFGVSVLPSLAKGLDAAKIGGTREESAGTITPIKDGNQKYKEREVMGTFSINNIFLTLDMLNLINKGMVQAFPLPMGNYILACTAGPNKDCLAVSIEQATEYQIDPDIISDEETLVIANVPYALYEEGSIKKCFYVLKRKVCLRVFR